ncbi:unnamed protein product [Closterium sp. NIES-53]
MLRARFTHLLGEHAEGANGIGHVLPAGAAVLQCVRMRGQQQPPHLLPHHLRLLQLLLPHLPLAPPPPPPRTTPPVRCLRPLAQSTAARASGSGCGGGGSGGGGGRGRGEA